MQRKWATASTPFHLASEDYPELGEILEEKPPPHVAEVITPAPKKNLSLFGSRTAIHDPATEGDDPDGLDEEETMDLPVTAKVYNSQWFGAWVRPDGSVNVLGGSAYHENVESNLAQGKIRVRRSGSDLNMQWQGALTQAQRTWISDFLRDNLIEQVYIDTGQKVDSIQSDDPEKLWQFVRGFDKTSAATMSQPTDSPLGLGDSDLDDMNAGTTGDATQGAADEDPDAQTLTDTLFESALHETEHTAKTAASHVVNVYRGIVANVFPSDFPIDLIHRLGDGTATPSDLMRVIASDGIGTYWADDDDPEYSDSFAEGEESLLKWKDEDPERWDTDPSGEVYFKVHATVAVADDWDSFDDLGGGNIAPGTPLNVQSIRWSADGVNWKTVQMNGLTATASWSDIVEKAKRIRSEGGVRIISVTSQSIAGHVQGDEGVYESELQFVPGTKEIGLWQCTCPWAAYSWGRSGPWKKYEGRMCSHALALDYQAQSEGMFGNTVREDPISTGWDKDITRYEAPPHSKAPEWRTASVKVNWQDWGEEGNHTHGTMEEEGTIPTSYIANMPGKMGEVPGEHRNRHGQQWEEFKQDIAANGIHDPIFITVDWNDRPYISEGNHRRDAAVELGMEEVPVTVRYFGCAEKQGKVSDGRTGYSFSKAAGLSLEAVVSVAEEAMERGGEAGPIINVPTGHQDDPVYQAAIAPLTAKVQEWVGGYARITASDYMLDRYNAQAMVEGQHIYTRPVTTTMAVLHECAHVITGSSEGSHSPEFARTARDLYAKYISPKAAETFWTLVGPYVEKTSSLANDVEPLYSVGRPSEELAREYAITSKPEEFAGHEMEVISGEYRALQILDPDVADLWVQLGLLCEDQMDQLKRSGWDVRVQFEDPYQTAEEMHADLAQKIYKVTTQHSHHPVWDVDTNVAFRVCHDILGHGEANSDFSFMGEVEAYRSQCRYLPENLWPVLFTEVVAQSAYANVHHLFGEQKVGLINYTPEQIESFVGKVMDAPDPDYDRLHFSASVVVAEAHDVSDEARADDGKWTDGGPHHHDPQRIVPLKGDAKTKSIAADLRMHDIPEEKRKAVQKTFKTGIGIEPREALHNLVSMFERVPEEERAKSAQWYQIAHDEALTEAGNFDLDPHVVLGVVAATSPGAQWEMNKKFARAICEAVSHADEPVPAEHIDLVNKMLAAKRKIKHDGEETEYDPLTDYQIPAGATYHQVFQESTRAGAILIGKKGHLSCGYGYGNIEKGLKIAMGDKSAITDLLAGAKVRSFYNNLEDPSSDKDVCIDSHMWRTFVNDPDQPGGVVDERLKHIDSKMSMITSSPAIAGAQVGAYPIGADLLHMATAAINAKHGTHYVPSQVQAILWIHQRQEYGIGDIRRAVNAAADGFDPHRIPVYMGENKEPEPEWFWVDGKWVQNTEDVPLKSLDAAFVSVLCSMVDDAREHASEIRSMAAVTYDSDHPMPEHFYHGTDAELQPGDVIVPGDQIGQDNWAMDNNHQVWMLADEGKPHGYGNHVYEVEPQDWVTNFSEEAGHIEEGLPEKEWEYVTPRATVVRRLSLASDPLPWDDEDEETNGVGEDGYDAVSQGRAEAILLKEPEPALPTTEGHDDEDEIAPGIPVEASRGWLMDGASGGGGDLDIAAGAREFLQKAAVKDFTFAEQQELINEGENVRTSNFDALDLAGTHYEGLEAALQEAEERDEAVLWW